MLSALVQEVCFGLLKWAGGLDRQGQPRRWWQDQAIMGIYAGAATQWTPGATRVCCYFFPVACLANASGHIGAPRQRASKQHGGHSGSSLDALAVFQDCWWTSGLRAGMFRAGIGCFLVVHERYGTEALPGGWVLIASQFVPKLSNAVGSPNSLFKVLILHATCLRHCVC